MVGILLNSIARENANESEVCPEGSMPKIEMSYGVAESGLLAEDTVLRRAKSDHVQILGRSGR